MDLTLYRLEGCPYCEKVVDVLEELELPFESVWVDAMHSNREEVKRVSGQRTVPVLVDHDNEVVMSESSDIVRYLRHNYGPEAEVTAD